MESSDFRRYSANMVILDVIPKKAILDVIPKKVILDVTQRKCD